MEFAIGGAINKEDLKKISEDGFKAVINFRTNEETNHLLTPNEEQKEAENLRLQYFHLPLSSSLKEWNEKILDNYREKLKALNGKVFAHCYAGRRALIFMLIHEGINKKQSGDEVLKKLESQNIEIKDRSVRDFIVDYVEKRNNG